MVWYTAQRGIARAQQRGTLPFVIFMKGVLQILRRFVAGIEVGVIEPDFVLPVPFCKGNIVPDPSLFLVLLIERRSRQRSRFHKLHEIGLQIG